MVVVVAGLLVDFSSIVSVGVAGAAVLLLLAAMIFDVVLLLLAGMIFRGCEGFFLIVSVVLVTVVAVGLLLLAVMIFDGCCLTLGRATTSLREEKEVPRNIFQSTNMAPVARRINKCAHTGAHRLLAQFGTQVRWFVEGPRSSRPCPRLGMFPRFAGN